MSRFIKLFVLVISPLLAHPQQEPSTDSFFPFAVGDQWEYGPAPTSKTMLTRDSLANGTHFLFYDNDSSPLYIIDSIGRVFYFNKYTSTIFSLEFNLHANLGDHWISQDTSSGMTVRVVARLDAITPDIIFGIPTTVKQFGYYYQLPNDSTNWSGWRDTRSLAAGFGYYSWVADAPGYVELLYGCVIDGLKYGSLAAVAEKQSVSLPGVEFVVYPNPFNPSTTVEYSLSRAEKVDLSVFDVLGRLVSKLVDGTQQAGAHRVRFVGQTMPSGVYFCRLTAGAQTFSRIIVLQR